MKTFKCDACGNTVYFENIRCLKCGHALGFQSERLEMSTLAPPSGKLYRELRRGAYARYAYCANEQQGGCNWLVHDGAATPFCAACALNRTIPDLSDPKNVDAWRSFERAKKRLVYSLLRLGLPLDGSAVGKGPLTFDFINDAITGHFDGVITIAVGEAELGGARAPAQGDGGNLPLTPRSPAPRERTLLLDAARRRHEQRQFIPAALR